MYAGALTTFLILLGSGIEPLPTTTPASFATGIVIVATLTAKLVTNGGRSAWFVGVLALMVYMIFAMTLYLLPPRIQ
jgi:Ca2+:H+ antiporter